MPCNPVQKCFQPTGCLQLNVRVREEGTFFIERDRLRKPWKPDFLSRTSMDFLAGPISPSLRSVRGLCRNKRTE
jgi:hypothetical protein